MKIKSPLQLAVLTLALSTFNPQSSIVFGQGSLTPPGPPAPTMKSLNQIEPRTPVSSLPFYITKAGSYFLTTNLTGVSAQDGITINASSVTLDLSGFELVGVPGSLAGINAPVEVTNLFIHNGTVRDWGDSGVKLFLAPNILLDHLHARQNAGSGIGLGDGCVVQHCSANSNAFLGIAAGGIVRDCASLGNGADGISASTVQSCVAESNGGGGVHGAESVSDCAGSYNHLSGISVENGGVVSRSVAQLNSGSGIVAGLGSLVQDSTVFNNGGTGIVAAVSCQIVNCVASGSSYQGIVTGQASTVKGCTARNNSLDGIQVPNDCVVLENNCAGNGTGLSGGAGIHATIAGNRIEGNSTILNKQGLWIQGGANVVIRNFSRYNPGSGSIGSSNFVISTGNTVGEILDFSSGGTLTNANPWANISY
jgi:hypothetical protein